MRAATVALVLLAACGASESRPSAVSTVGTTTTVAPRGDAIRYVPRPRFVRLIPPAAASRGSARGDVWTRLAMCESTMRNVRNPPYSGYFQFLGSTWRSLGYSGEAADYPYETQLAGAKRLLARSGRGQWPVCGPRVGL